MLNFDRPRRNPARINLPRGELADAIGIITFSFAFYRFVTMNNPNGHFYDGPAWFFAPPCFVALFWGWLFRRGAQDYLPADVPNPLTFFSAANRPQLRLRPPEEVVAAAREARLLFGITTSIA